ncbi:MAG: ABC transporter permease [Bacteroidetes bacterium]|nr:ABC transporter permease [Bacteroidota bacterium]
MLKNYLKTALRGLWKNKSFSAINIAGLAAGLSVCLLIVLYVTDELSYDRYNTKAERIYRANADIFFNNTKFNAATSPRPLAAVLAKDYPQIEQVTRVSPFAGNILVKKGKENIQEHSAAQVDSNFFKVFTIPMLYGDPATALSSPDAIVIDETAAKKYLNRIDVVGQTLMIDNTTPCLITGVIKDIPAPSHFHFSFIRRLRSYNPNEDNDWLSNGCITYILAKPGVTKASLQGCVDQTIHTYLYKQLEQVAHTTVKDMQQGGSHFNYPLMAVTDIHLHSDKLFELEANSDITYVYIFSVIAGLILVIACVNFMNLSTARSANRAKEVGIRKVAGSLRSNLILQFLTESILVSFVSMLLAFGLAALFLPMFDRLSGKQLQVETLLSFRFLSTSFLLMVLVGFLAGCYPAFYLSSFQPIQVLKGRVASGFKSSWLRSSLVVFQFSISIALIVGTLVIYNQLDYIRNKKTGFSREQVLVLHNAYHLGNQIHSFRQEVAGLPGVAGATITSSLPTSEPNSHNQNGWFRDASLDGKSILILNHFIVDESYIPTLKIEIAQGKNFSTDFKADSNDVILNEAAARLLGVKDPLNMTLYRPNYRSADNVHAIPYHIVGIVKDFNFSTMHDKIGPLVMEYGQDWGNIAVSVNPRNVSSLVDQIGSKWKSMAPGQPFSYTFMDADFEKLYHTDQRTGKLFITFAVFAILIACLGLFGLVTYAAEQRTKEIGIRKVLGAPVSSIVVMLSSDFARLVLIAALIAFPLAGWAMNSWLQSFAYRISLGWWAFVAAGLITMAIALLTVSLQTIRAALANPVKSLKSE